MKVVLLGYKSCDLYFFLRKHCEVYQTDEKISIEELESIDPDLIVSYDYKHILQKPVIQKYERKILNIHQS